MTTPSEDTAKFFIPKSKPASLPVFANSFIGSMNETIDINKEGKDAIVEATCNLHGGGKFVGQEGYKSSLGLHGLGLKCIHYLSSKFFSFCSTIAILSIRLLCLSTLSLRTFISSFMSSSTFCSL